MNKRTTHARDVEAIKCVIWDLDNTLWNGILLEDTPVRLSEHSEKTIKCLDERGILQSVASKNSFTKAMAKLKEFGIAEYFLYPQINWNSKVQSIRDIAGLINIGLDAIAFIDDNPAEIDEVAFSLPEVRGILADQISGILGMPCMQPKFKTVDQQRRRQLYLAGIERDEAENKFVGPQEAFLASLKMELTIYPARAEDLQRAEELTVRTHQLNTTGYTYTYDALDRFRTSPDHLLLMARLKDRYGTYGNIGLTLLECRPSRWVIKLLLMSCRVMSRGVGTVMLNHLIHLAREKGKTLQAEFIPNDRNRRMNVTYRFAGFEEIENKNGRVLFQHPMRTAASFPDYMNIIIL